MYKRPWWFERNGYDISWRYLKGSKEIYIWSTVHPRWTCGGAAVSESYFCSHSCLHRLKLLLVKGQSWSVAPLAAERNRRSCYSDMYILLARVFGQIMSYYSALSKEHPKARLILGPQGRLGKSEALNPYSVSHIFTKITELFRSPLVFA